MEETIKILVAVVVILVLSSGLISVILTEVSTNTDLKPYYTTLEQVEIDASKVLNNHSIKVYQRFGELKKERYEEWVNYFFNKSSLRDQVEIVGYSETYCGGLGRSRYLGGENLFPASYIYALEVIFKGYLSPSESKGFRTEKYLCKNFVYKHKGRIPKNIEGEINEKTNN